MGKSERGMSLREMRRDRERYGERGTPHDKYGEDGERSKGAGGLTV